MNIARQLLWKQYCWPIFLKLIFYLSPVTSPAQHEFNIIHCKVKEEEGKSFTVFKKPLKSVLKLSHNSTYLFLLLPWGHLKHRKIVQIKKNCNRENLSLKHSESFYGWFKIYLCYFLISLYLFNIHDPFETFNNEKKILSPHNSLPISQIFLIFITRKNHSTLFYERTLFCGEMVPFSIFACQMGMQFN